MKKLVALVLALAMALCCVAAVAEEAGVYVGLGSVTSFGHYDVDQAEEGKDGSCEVDTTMAIVAVDENGVIAYAKIDVAQNKVTWNATGACTLDKTAPTPTKWEKLDAYNMKPASPIGKEWYEQATAFADWMVGKTVEEVKAGVEAKDEALLAGCTMSTGDMVAAVEKAVADALGK
ncbi:MAG: hypothetical protein Q4C54_04900 [Clostridia bacterium]|nr:hypothetical protein [Clostridia bacterium]